MRLALLSALLLAAGPLAAGPIDRALEAAQPCAAIPGFNATDEIDISRVDLTLRRDLVTLRAEGDIGCTATGPGPLRGNLTARMIVRAELDSTTCELDELDLDIGTLGGTLAPAVTPGLPEMQGVLARAMGLAITQACKRNLGPYLE